ncbi:hypothetical protein [Hominisplanchenecus murintestinalis]|uniref:hypothetical protein n=1 Tax=Hominisplanchenecus murintestinalis TaxID=2941517 RepID=UPI00203CB032|nr:hypothetical protein [Hominisplanchenecus murintestinalis]
MSENWIVPCSVKFFDVVKHFEENDTIVWRKVSALKKGDTAYIYIGAPYSEIKYKCHIVDDDVDEKTLQSNEYAIRKTESGKRQKYIKMKLDHVYDDGELSLDKLRANSLGQTQIQARTDRRLQAFISNVDRGLGI